MDDPTIIIIGILISLTVMAGLITILEHHLDEEYDATVFDLANLLWAAVGWIMIIITLFYSGNPESFFPIACIIGAILVWLIVLIRNIQETNWISGFFCTLAQLIIGALIALFFLWLMFKTAKEEKT